MTPLAQLQAGLQALRTAEPEQALRCFEAVLAADPAHPDALYLSGIALAGMGQVDPAVARLRAAIALQPERAALHYNLGKLLQDAGRLDPAEAAYRTTIALQPDFAEALANLALVVKERGETAEASALFQRSFHLRRAHAAPHPAPPAPMKQRHDAQQRAYLAGLGVPVDDLDGLTRLHLEPGAALSEPVLAASLDPEALQERYLAGDPRVLVVDELLSPAGLHALRRHCLQSTFWFSDRYLGGYLGAYWEQGFGAPLLVQIATELRAALPRVLGPHPLQQMWAYTYDSAGGGIGVHADSAAVNVNFWITPDLANLDPDSGGLVVHHCRAPRDWDHAAYNSRDSEAAIEARIAADGGGETRVPYRANRAVLFDSDLFHRTDRYRFRPGFEHRRINVTMLFGWRDGRR